MKVSASAFADFLLERYKKKDGYIMGATGQDPSKWAANSYWFTQYDDRPNCKKKALYWRTHAERVWDCQGMSEGYYKDITGTDVNTKARYNYANWCDPKGSGLIPSAYRQRGAAVFWSDTSDASKIHHVAYLVEPVDKNNPMGDWYLVEARSVLLGVCKTKLLSRKPNFWGLMTKYFDYENTEPQPLPIPSVCPYAVPTKTVKRGNKGESVLWVQWHLLMWDSGCLPRYGMDGSFGAETDRAVRDYQNAKGLKVDGLVGPKTAGAMIADEAWIDPDPLGEIDPEYIDHGQTEDYEDFYIDEDGYLAMTPEERAEVEAELARAEREGT